MSRESTLCTQFVRFDPSTFLQCNCCSSFDPYFAEMFQSRTTGTPRHPSRSKRDQLGKPCTKLAHQSDRTCLVRTKYRPIAPVGLDAFLLSNQDKLASPSNSQTFRFRKERM